MSKGRFVWFELMTTDPDAAKAFYSEVIGWKTQAWDGPNDYTMFCVGERPIGGLMELPAKAKEHGAPPHWLGHVQVPDSDATAARVKELGGTVLHQEQIPTVGKFSIIQDGQGAVLSAFTPENDMTPPDEAQPGDVSWNELNTTDWEAGWKYYSQLFGWQEADKMDMGPEMGMYFMYKYEGAERAVGGMSNVAKAQNIPSHWLYYVTVDDLDAAVDRVKQHGGQVLNGPMEVPGGERIAQCMDPQGAAFALHSKS